MEEPTLIPSKNGKCQLYHKGYSFTANKSTKNNRTYMRCVSRNGTSKCNASSSIQGSLEEGKFELLYHNIEKHNHEPSIIDKLVKNFNADLKTTAVKLIGTPVQQLYEDLKIQHTRGLSPQDQQLFLQKIPAQKSALMQGYRARGSEYKALPKMLKDVQVCNQFVTSLDEETLYRGSTSDGCHLFMSSKQCKMLRLNIKKSLILWLFLVDNCKIQNPNRCSPKSVRQVPYLKYGKKDKKQNREIGK